MNEQRDMNESVPDRGWIGFIDDFVGNLKSLPRGDVAKIARGSMRGDALRAFYRILPFQLKKHDNVLMTVAVAYSICKGGPRFTGSFGKTARVTKEVGGSESLDRRFTTILDSNIDNGELEHRLIHMVKLAKSKGIGIDWKQLALDVINWNRDGKPVQKQWAFDYFSNRPLTDNKNEA